MRFAAKLAKSLGSAVWLKVQRFWIFVVLHVVRTAGVSQGRAHPQHEVGSANPVSNQWFCLKVCRGDTTETSCFEVLLPRYRFQGQLRWYGECLYVWPDMRVSVHALQPCPSACVRVPTFVHACMCLHASWKVCARVRVHESAWVPRWQVVELGVGLPFTE